MLQNKIPWKLYEFAQAIVDGLRAHSLPWVSSKLRMYVSVSQLAAGLRCRSVSPGISSIESSVADVCAESEDATVCAECVAIPLFAELQ